MKIQNFVKTNTKKSIFAILVVFAVVVSFLLPNNQIFAYASVGYADAENLHISNYVSTEMQKETSESERGGHTLNDIREMLRRDDAYAFKRQHNPYYGVRTYSLPVGDMLAEMDKLLDNQIQAFSSSPNANPNRRVVVQSAFVQQTKG